MLMITINSPAGCFESEIQKVNKSDSERNAIVEWQINIKTIDLEHRSQVVGQVKYYISYLMSSTKNSENRGQKQKAAALEATRDQK